MFGHSLTISAFLFPSDAGTRGFAVVGDGPCAVPNEPHDLPPDNHRGLSLHHKEPLI